MLAFAGMQILRALLLLMMTVSLAHGRQASTGPSQNVGNAARTERPLAAQKLTLSPVPANPPRDSISEITKFIVGIASVLAAAIIGLFGTTFAWVYVPAKIRRSEDRAKFIETQLSELYGPLLGECLRTDRMFLQIEWTIANSFSQEHHHSRLQPLLGGTLLGENTALPSFFASVIRKVYHPANLVKVQLLKNKVHLFGPYPPMSFHLLLNHAAELEAILALGEKRLLLDAIETPLSSEAVGRVAPYPMALTAEVLAKVVLLKKLQKEYRSRLSSIRTIFVGTRKVFNRDRYFLEIKSDIRTELDKLHTCNSYTCSNFPLLWGPYLPVELIEMRSWFIAHSDLLADQPNLLEHKLITDAFLSATIIFVDPRGNRTFDLDCRVFQAFDSLDPLRSKQRILWRTSSESNSQHVNTKQKSNVRFSALKVSGKKETFHSLEHFPPNEDFAQNPRQFSLLHKLNTRGNDAG